MAVNPLFHVLSMEGVLDRLDSACNRPPADFPWGSPAHGSYQVFSRYKVQRILEQIKGGYYAIPKQGTEEAVAQYTSLLNSLLNEFSAPPGSIPSSHAYVQIVDCAVELYESLQTHATCSPTVQGKHVVDSGPFCASYHLSSDSSAQGSNKRSSLYFFMPNTMLEFPFAWWYKCIILQGRILDSGQEVVHCSEWQEDIISTSQMESDQSGMYSSEDVRGILMKINGGVTSEAIRQALLQLDSKLQAALLAFSLAGSALGDVFPGYEQFLSRNAMAVAKPRLGASWDFNMKCYRCERSMQSVSSLVEV
jgi:hypothetical protein